MDLSNLSARCYDGVSPERIAKALDDAATRAPELARIFTARHLEAQELAEAKARASRRLELYYSKLLGLIRAIPWEHVPQLQQTIESLHEADRVFLDRVYDQLGSIPSAGGVACGRALFLRVASRSFPLLKEPGLELTPESTLVYMCPDWLRALFSTAGNDRDGLVDRLIRSNRLWQRERLNVEAAVAADAQNPVATLGTSRPRVDDFEPTRPCEPHAVDFFNNIALHPTATDGWVDAFWGVQSGLRIPLSIPGSGATLFLLLTSYVPDLFRPWTLARDQYVEQLPQPLADALTAAFQSTLDEVLQSLSHAASLLSGSLAAEDTLLDIAMRSMNHHFGPEPPGSAPLAAARRLAQELVEIDARAAPLCRPFLIHTSDLFSTLKSISDELPETPDLVAWRVRLNAKQVYYASDGLGLLPPDTTVRAFIRKLQAEAAAKRSVFARGENLQEIDTRTVSIHGYLLTSVASNLFQRDDVYAHASIEISDRFPNPCLRVTAVYPRWALRKESERDFLLSPVTNPGGRGRGFYLTAEVLRWHGGSIEYYRVPLPDCGFQNVGLISLVLPVR